ncbi:MAG: hypothetical protein JXB50_12780 [Spirochaetes bacterium]|nr:hypothetical protein [Spirochaetota bacterium]
MIKKIIFIFMILIVLLNAKLIFKEKEPYEYPKFLKLDEKEANGLKLKINIADYFMTIPDITSAVYRRPILKRFNNNIYAQKKDTSDYQNIWVSQTINNQGDYIINRESKWRYNSIVFDKNNKPLYIERDPSERFKSDLLLPEISKFYIPDSIIKIGEEWKLEFKDIKPEVINKDNDKKYHEIFMSGKYKLLGYADHKNIRCAVIESVITINTFDMFIKSSSQYRIPGSGILINSEIHSLVYLDYSSDKVVFSKTYIKQIAQGNYLEKFGDSPVDAKQNILKEYEGLINGDETYIMQIFYYYKYTGGKK